jgi:hypothetical protein
MVECSLLPFPILSQFYPKAGLEASSQGLPALHPFILIMEPKGLENRALPSIAALGVEEPENDEA